MIRALFKAQTYEEKTLAFVQLAFLLIAMFGFLFYGIEHWALEHFLDSWQSRVPFYLSLLGFPLTFLMLFSTKPWIRYPFIAWMAITFLSGMIGALFHLVWNADDINASLFSISGFIDSFRGDRPVLAALAHTHIGAVGLIIGLTLNNTSET
ncbi:MAG: hypothetical protein KC422_03425 [Trueperaceae bacterium]|nr:hypothetical protein [Trueperaceae bacterium]